jgi:POT family proton-dependent oligopeptide transporter
MVNVGWLLAGYLVQTLGELCLSPVGLSMITKLSPTRLVSTVMGAWFLATAFSQYLAGIISQFTRIDEASGGIPEPIRTVNVYGDVFGIIAIWGIAAGLACLALSPLLRRWMHDGVDQQATADLAK